MPIAIGLQKGFAEKCQFHVSANLGYLEAIKSHFEAKNRTFGPIFSRIQLKEVKNIDLFWVESIAFVMEIPQKYLFVVIKTARFMKKKRSGTIHQNEISGLDEN